ncbi:glucose 1-dehydrogenase [Halobaculum lipolyticum]|uniref:Glucose 1-dehydrogenase n=1 Tax=Halobaculum lipolyticum TaxID=3032001 RepID=A0ABD5WB18_9EURY|nr:glucose 1-dehydrogenase [Halobaculum sp. DT31]
MKAVTIEQGDTGVTVREVPDPVVGPEDVLVRTLRVGIDGTDHEVIGGSHGGYPAGETYQILGHEAIGVVEDPNGSDLQQGQLVVPTVRRPPPDGGTNAYFDRGEPDMAPDGSYVERGIVGAHGFMSEYVATPAEFLVPVPDSFAEYGFLIEPISNIEKAIEHALATRSAFEWTPESAFVLGNGPLGLLAVAVLTQDAPMYDQFERGYCLGRRDRPDPTIEIIERLGATYVDSRETPVSAFKAAHEPADLIVEATGYAAHPFEAITALAPNGVAALLGIPDDWTIDLDAGRLHRELVLENKALVGSVNSNIPQFERARDSLTRMPEWFLDELVTGVFEPAAAPEAFADDTDAIKTVIEFDTV